MSEIFKNTTNFLAILCFFLAGVPILYRYTKVPHLVRIISVLAIATQSTILVFGGNPTISNIGIQLLCVFGWIAFMLAFVEFFRVAPTWMNKPEDKS